MIALLFALAQATAPGAPVPGAEERLARWREDLALDLAAVVVRDGRAQVSAGGALASDGRLVAVVARALHATGKDDEALALLGASAPSPQTSAWVAVELAWLALERDELDAALRALAGTGPQDPLRHPDVPDAWLIAGRALARKGRLADAAPYLQRFLELAPLASDAPSAWHQLAQAMIAKGDAAQAQTYFERARASSTWQGYWRARSLQVREHPEDPLPLLGMGQLLLEASDHARAQALLSTLVQRFPDYAQGWLHLGEAERKRDALDLALRAYTRALELDPGLALARFNRAVIEAKRERPSDARADLEVLVASPSGSDPRFIEAHLMLARIHTGAGELDAAAERYRRYVELGGKEPLEPPAR